MTVPSLVLEAVEKSYGRTRALRNVTFSADAGQFVVLLGLNGAGKSTLIQLLTGLFVPDSGSIRVLGEDMLRSPTRALASIGVVFQQPTLDLELSVGANLRFHADLHGMSRRDAETAIAEALEQFGLSGRAKDRAADLSGGNRRRLELARALLHRPAILLMDEPTVGLDPESRRDLLARILALRADVGVLVLWATHLVDEAEHADRLLFLHEGALVFDGTTSKARELSGAETAGAAFLRLIRRPTDAR